MQTAKSNERRGLNAIVGLAVAGATLMAGLVALPVSKASAYTTDDDFRTTISPTDKPKLTVTKYLSTKPGQPATGSSADGVIAADGNTPASEVVFNVFEVEAVSGNIADVDPLKPETYKKVSGQAFAGITNGAGVIDNWFEAATDGSLTATPKEFPAGIHYYVMIENQGVSPSFKPGGRYAGQGYEAAQNSFFSLPYRTQDGSQDAGYLYHLHLYPKNVNNSDITKQVTTWTDGTGHNGVLARPGDTLTYQLNQKIYNEHPTDIVSPNTSNKDGKLDVAELRQGKTDLRVSDRMSTALEYMGSPTVTLVAGTATKTLTTTDDYSSTFDENVPKSFDNTRELSTSKDLFPNNPGGGTKYLTFDFFKNADSIKAFATANDVPVLTLQISFQAKVTANGDSTGASQGSIQNTVMSTNSDVGDKVNPSGRIDTPAATASFGKVKKDGTALPGAVFRLVDPTDDNKFLASDGNTYPDDGSLDPGKTFYTAKSNDQGAVVFTALPIIGADGYGRYGDWRLQEWTVPAGYDRPSVIFSKISFAPANAGDYDIQGKTAAQIVSQFGSKPLEASHKFLSFGRYVYNNGAAPTTPISVGGHQVDNYLANYVKGEGPVNLPLTGGRGIVLLLVIGLMVMGGALYARNRRNASRA